MNLFSTNVSMSMISYEAPNHYLFIIILPLFGSKILCILYLFLLVLVIIHLLH